MDRKNISAPMNKANGSSSIEQSNEERESSSSDSMHCSEWSSTCSVSTDDGRREQYLDLIKAKQIQERIDKCKDDHQTNAWKFMKNAKAYFVSKNSLYDYNFIVEVFANLSTERLVFRYV